jgi:hypothetical protein
MESDGVYSFEYTFPTGAASGTKLMPITVIDHSANEVYDELRIEIQENSAPDSDSESALPGFEGSGLILCLIGILFLISVRNQYNHKR